MMDTDRFDAIARLAARAPRRRVLVGLVAACVTGLVGRSGVVAAPGDYENRGQRCIVSDWTTGANDCTSPCRYCDDGRCIYACNNTLEVCDASATWCNRAE